MLSKVQFINNFTGGEFAIEPPAGPANAIKHVVLEGYVDKRLDKTLIDASFFNASIAGVDDFIYRTLVDAQPGTILSNQLLRAGAPSTNLSIPRIFSTLRAELVVDIAAKRAAAKNCGTFDFSCSATILNLKARYEEAWRDDIDAGLRAWPGVSHQVAIALFFNSNRKADTDTAFTVLQNYATNHLLSMAGAPDFVGLTISVIGGLIDAITPDFLLEPIRQLKAELLDTLLDAAIGMTKEELKNYLNNPELSFDTIMNSGDGENVTLLAMNSQYLHLADTGYTNPNEGFDYSKVPATYNTATMSKLILLSQSEINRLLADLGSFVRLNQPNIMLGFVPSLDGSRQWLNGMVFAQDSNAYRQIFMLQPGETPLNGAPVAQPDSGYTTTDNTPLVVAAPGVLGNDTDPDGDPLTATLTLKDYYQPQHGAVTMAPNGGFTYTPTGVALDDAFGYYVSDGLADSDIVWVVITVTPGNDPPVARDDGTGVAPDSILQAYQDQPFTLPAPGVLINDSDPDGNPITALVVTAPANGTLTLDAAGSFVYTPTSGFFGDDSFTYKANDGAADSAPATVSLNVFQDFNEVFANDESYVTLKNTPLVVAAPGLLANDTNRDGLPLTAVLTNDSNRGTVTLSPDGSFVFTPEVDFVGDTGFLYEATDGVVSSAGSATQIIIRATNAAPVAEQDSYTTTGSAPLIVAAPGVLGNDWDTDYHPEYEGFGLPPTDPKRAILVSGPSAGDLTLHEDGSFIYTPTVALSTATVAAVGRDSFTYKSSDPWSESNVATLRISDATVNHAPVANDDAYQTPKNTQLLQPAPGILANDLDGDGDPLAILPERAPTAGAVKLNPDGSFVYSPTIDYVGLDSFGYSIADTLGVTRTATVTVTVGNPVAQNQTPTAANDQATTPKGVAVTIDVKANDIDLDGDPLTLAILTQPISGTAVLNNAKIVYTPQAGFVGSVSFTYRASDGKGGNATATVTVIVTDPNVINQQPTAANDQGTTPQGVAVTLAVMANDGDPDGDPLTVTIVTQPTHGTATVSANQIVYTPVPGFSGSDSFTYRVSDDKGGAATATVTVTVGPGSKQQIHLPLATK